MTCKDCIKFDVCKKCFYFDRFGDEYHFDYCDYRDIDKCDNFLNRSKIVELPCEIDKFRNIEATYKKYLSKEFAIVEYPCQKNKPQKVVPYSIYGVDLISKEPLRIFDYLSSMNFIVVKYGFATKEEAEKALKERD